MQTEYGIFRGGPRTADEYQHGISVRWRWPQYWVIAERRNCGLVRYFDDNDLLLYNLRMIGGYRMLLPANMVYSFRNGRFGKAHGSQPLLPWRRTCFFALSDWRKRFVLEKVLLKSSYAAELRCRFNEYELLRPGMPCRHPVDIGLFLRRGQPSILTDRDVHYKL